MKIIKIKNNVMNVELNASELKNIDKLSITDIVTLKIDDTTIDAMVLSIGLPYMNIVVDNKSNITINETTKVSLSIDTKHQIIETSVEHPLDKTPYIFKNTIVENVDELELKALNVTKYSQLETGYIGIDLAIPLARGQKMLILNEKGTRSSEFVLNILKNQARIRQHSNKLEDKLIKNFYIKLGSQEAFNKPDYIDYLDVIDNVDVFKTITAIDRALATAKNYQDSKYNVNVIIDGLEIYLDKLALVKKNLGQEHMTVGNVSVDAFSIIAKLVDRAKNYGTSGSISLILTLEVDKDLNQEAKNVINTLKSITDGHISLRKSEYIPDISHMYSVSRIVPDLSKVEKLRIKEYKELLQKFDAGQTDTKSILAKSLTRHGNNIYDKNTQHLLVDLILRWSHKNNDKEKILRTVNSLLDNIQTLIKTDPHLKELFKHLSTENIIHIDGNNIYKYISDITEHLNWLIHNKDEDEIYYNISNINKFKLRPETIEAIKLKK